MVAEIHELKNIFEQECKRERNNLKQERLRIARLREALRLEENIERLTS